MQIEFNFIATELTKYGIELAIYQQLPFNYDMIKEYTSTLTTQKFKPFKISREMLAYHGKFDLIEIYNEFWTSKCK